MLCTRIPSEELTQFFSKVPIWSGGRTHSTTHSLYGSDAATAGMVTYPPCLHYLFATLTSLNSLEDGEVFEQLLGVRLRVNAKLLRQVAKRLAHFILLIQQVYPAGPCKVARMRISVDLPAPLGPPYIPLGIVRVTSFSACAPWDRSSMQCHHFSDGLETSVTGVCRPLPIAAIVSVCS